MLEEKKCKYCAMMIPKEAKICPHCRKKQGTSFIVGFLAVIVTIFLFGLIISMISTPSSTTTTNKPAYTDEQKKAAREYFKILMDSGMVTEFKGEGKIQIVYVDKKMWSIGTYENKKTILKTLSQSNEILNKTPWIEIRDHRSGKVYGALKPPLTMDIYE